ncbi:MAG: penicillin-binding transpeptidase domain-containing protein, partial [Solirubrobacteraceae bacterium]
MIDELDWVRSLRPPAPPAPREVREIALKALEEAIAAELATASSSASVLAKKPRGATVPIAMSDSSVADRWPEQVNRRRGRFAPGLGWLASAASVIVALVIAGAAVVLVGHSAPGSRGAARSGAPAVTSRRRGLILDRSGAALVTNRAVVEVEINAGELPVSDGSRAAEYRLLASVLGISGRRSNCALDGHRIERVTAIACEVARGQAQGEGSVTVAEAVSSDVIASLRADKRRLPGVILTRQYVRDYPFGTLAAQVLGTVGAIDAVKTHEARDRGVPRTAIMGQSGLEYEYDHYLRAGDNLRTSLDTGLERVGTNALQESMDLNHSPGGAFVALDPDNGQVYAMGSLPSYDPSVFAGNDLSQSAYDQLISANSGDPLLDRADQSAGPTGSTFKVITATAALESGDWLVDDTFDDTGQFCFPGTSDCLHNAGHAANGVLDLVSAIRVSDDVFFYNLGALTNVDQPQGGPLQTWARIFGIGRTTGIDLPSEVAGTLPTPAWRAHENELETECEDATGPFTGHPRHPASQGGCGITVVPQESWTIGDNANLAVGQGDVQVTPLQMAVVYSALANGGTIVTPHIGADIENEDGTVLQKINPPPSRHVEINPLYLDTIRKGLREAASQPGGTSADVFGNFPQQVYGKTGTAQYISDGVEEDYAWYACFVPDSATNKPIAVVVTVEKGGFGAIAAAPVAREILSQWF